MADTREIKVVLETVDGSSAGSSGEEERVDTQASRQGNSSNKQASAAVKMFATMMASEALNEVVSWVTYEINKEYTLNDDYIGQRNLSIATQAVNWGISSASTIASTTLMGAQFGPVGAVIGAAIGVGTVAAKTARANAQAMEQQDIRLNQMEAQLDYTRQRSGYSLKAASIGENL